jgi:hypothetical protein
MVTIELLVPRQPPGYFLARCTSGPTQSAKTFLLLPGIVSIEDFRTCGADPAHNAMAPDMQSI